MDNKCTNCGCEDVFLYRVKFNASNSFVSLDEKNVTAYACKKCRHIDFYVTNNVIDEQTTREYQEIEYKKKSVEYEINRALLQQQIAEVNKIIRDDNQLVKVVNEAKELLSQLDNRLRTLVKPQPPNKPN